MNPSSTKVIYLRGRLHTIGWTPRGGEGCPVAPSLSRKWGDCLWTPSTTAPSPNTWQTIPCSWCGCSANSLPWTTLTGSPRFVAWFCYLRGWGPLSLPYSPRCRSSTPGTISASIGLSPFWKSARLLWGLSPALYIQRLRFTLHHLDGSCLRLECRSSPCHWLRRERTWNCNLPRISIHSFCRVYHRLCPGHQLG